MSFGTDYAVEYLQYFFGSVGKYTYWYVPIKSNTVNEDFDFVEVEEDTMVAFSDINVARAACEEYGWPGLLELGPRKWKSLNIQQMARPRKLLKNPGRYSTSTKPHFSTCRQAERPMILTLGTIVLFSVWYTFNEMVCGPFMLVAFLISRIVSPLFQFFVSFLVFCLSTFLVGINGGISVLLTWSLAFSSVEVYEVFAPKVYIVNIDHINLRDMD